MYLEYSILAPSITLDPLEVHLSCYFFLNWQIYIKGEKWGIQLNTNTQQDGIPTGSTAPKEEKKLRQPPTS